MRKPLLSILSFLLLQWSTVAAQESELSSLQRELSIFAGILEESLALNENTGLFGMSLGGVDSLYLDGQGALFEIRSPLASRRNRMGLASLSSAMQALQLRQNPFQALSLRAGTNAATEAEGTDQASPASGLYEDLLAQIAEFDFNALTQNAMQQASQSARAMRALGSLDDEGFQDLESELAEIRSGLNSGLQQLRELEQEIRGQVSAEAQGGGQSEFSARLEGVKQVLGAIKDRAEATAQQLREQSQQAESEYAAAWQADLIKFRSTLYQTLCEYGATLEDLPANESISIVLKGLGEDRGENRRTDQILIVSKAEVEACSDGRIDAVALQNATTSYSY